MRLYANKLPELATACCKVLLAAGDIEASAPQKVEQDLVSVLQSYLQTDREISEKAKEYVQQSGRSQQDFGRIRRQFADSAGHKIGDDALDYLLDQLVSVLNDSPHVDEIFAEDIELRRKLRDVLRKYVFIDEQLDAEVRTQLRHVREGTRAWDVEYQRVLEQVRRRRGLS